MKRNNNKQKRDDLKKYYTKNDIFLSRMASILRMPKGTVNNLFKLRTVTAIRLNPLVMEPEKALLKLRKQGFDMERVKWLDNTYIVLNKDKSEIGKLPEYFEGLYYIQNLSSMIPPQVLDPKPNEKILDMCAAPGSKTTQLAAMMMNQGHIVANDVDAWRVGKLKNVLEIFKVTNTEVRNEEAGVYAQEQEQYDKILLDAPCSGEGMIYIAKPMALRFWNVKKAKGFSKLQEQLITAAFKALKKGGTMIYSTCTLEPDENEGAISYLLKTQPKAQVHEIPLFASAEFGLDKKNVKRGILKWNGKEYSKEVSKTYRVIPSERMMGFYIAMIKKAE